MSANVSAASTSDCRSLGVEAKARSALDFLQVTAASCHSPQVGHWREAAMVLLDGAAGGRLRGWLGGCLKLI
jgi:hypothetical protein